MTEFNTTFDIGQKVIIDKDHSLVATVIQILIDEGGNVQYKISWVHGGDVKEAWVSQWWIVLTEWRAEMTTIGKKVDYVHRQRQTRKHACHWPGCNRQVPPAQWGCKSHWYALPKVYRDRIWKTYRPQQEIDMRPSKDYLLVAEEVQSWIRQHGEE